MRKLCATMIVLALLCAGCTIVNARIDATADGVTISAGVAGISTDVTIPIPDLLPEPEPEPPTE